MKMILQLAFIGWFFYLLISGSTWETFGWLILGIIITYGLLAVSYNPSK